MDQEGLFVGMRQRKENYGKYCQQFSIFMALRHASNTTGINLPKFREGVKHIDTRC